MTAGRGWIAVVAVMLARAHPVGVLAAALLFGFAEAIGFRLQGQGLPSQITEAAPYVVTLVALLFATVAPTSPINRPRMLAAKVLSEAAGTVRAIVQALRAGDLGVLPRDVVNAG